MPLNDYWRRRYRENACKRCDMLLGTRHAWHNCDNSNVIAKLEGEVAGLRFAIAERAYDDAYYQKQWERTERAIQRMTHGRRHRT